MIDHDTRYWEAYYFARVRRLLVGMLRYLPLNLDRNFKKLASVKKIRTVHMRTMNQSRAYVVELNHSASKNHLKIPVGKRRDHEMPSPRHHATSTFPLQPIYLPDRY